MKFSYKDLLLLIGILVAAIIAFTTLIYRDHTEDNKQSVEKTSMNPTNTLIIEKIVSETIQNSIFKIKN